MYIFVYVYIYTHIDTYMQTIFFFKVTVKCTTIITRSPNHLPIKAGFLDKIALIDLLLQKCMSLYTVKINSF